jgi:hypothetical protein
MGINWRRTCTFLKSSVDNPPIDSATLPVLRFDPEAL